MQPIHPRLVEIALSEVRGADFERFFREFGAAIEGENFVPLGGVHDRGADAFSPVPPELPEGLYSLSRRPDQFYQASVEADTRSKIRRTLKRLGQVGRKPKVLWYYTSQEIRDLDDLEIGLSEEFDCHIRIKHRSWIAANINKSSQTQAAFHNHLTGPLAFLGQFGGGALTTQKWDRAANRTACIFLSQEVERRKGNETLSVAVTDSLILWALEGTDPDLGIFLSKDQILQKIELDVPFSLNMVKANLDNRLALLSSKKNPSGREVRIHNKAEPQYCLPYETRLLVKQENEEDAILAQEVLDLFSDRAAEILGKGDNRAEVVAKAAMEVIHRTFEGQGLELASFLSADVPDFKAMPAISDYVDDVAPRYSAPEFIVPFKEAVISVMRGAFYQSTPIERKLLSKLSRTYFFLLTVSAEPKVIDYFQSMSRELILFVGPDLIIRALSERYLPDEDQMTVNLLRLLKEAGATLYLLDAAGDEITNHLRSTDADFKRGIC